MAKRFSATDIWDEDWFLCMPNEYKLFWFFMLSTCDHAGFFKVNLRSFCSLLEVKVNGTSALEFFNYGKQRIRIITDNIWFIEDFFAYQYSDKFNINNPLHRGVKKLLDKHGVELSSIRGLFEVNLTIKEKDKEKEIIREGGAGETNSSSKTKTNGFSKDFKVERERTFFNRLERNAQEYERNGKSDS